MRANSEMMHKSPPIERIEAQALRRQQIAFCILTLTVLAALLLLHSYFADLLGKPSKHVFAILALAFSIKVFEIVWLWQRTAGITERIARITTAVSTVGIFVLTATLVVLTDRDDAPYFVLLSVPILQSAYRFGIVATLTTVASAITMIFWWAQHFFRLHPPPRPTEFLEAGMISVIFCLMGSLVWYLVRQLELKQARLYQNMEELQSTREKLAVEEKLAAVGRFASGIAHEIRNPVAMIASSLETAAYPQADTAEREEMFAIAAREAKRLESLTNEFLTYARPTRPLRSPFPITDILGHIISMTRARAVERSIAVVCDPCDDITLEIDPSQVEGALVNLSLNALDATPPGGRIVFRTAKTQQEFSIEIENSGSAIPADTLLRIFEPFFTTKPTGTGLGLAIARRIAEAHGGELRVSQNREGAVAFTMTLSMFSTEDEPDEVAAWRRS